MAEGMVRKTQPFTLGTKLSVPTGPKYGAHFTEGYPPSQDPPQRPPQPGLKDQVSPYLGGAGGSPVAVQVSRLEGRQVEAEEDHPTRNAALLSTSSRAIRKITISQTPEPPGDAQTPLSGGSPKSENINNNNNITSPALPRIIGVSCESKPSPHFKVLLRKDGHVGARASGSGGPSNRTTSGFQIPVLRALSSNREPPKGEVPSCGHPEAPPTKDCSFTQRHALFNRELLQAEEWIKAKQQELRDAQHRPLQDRLSHTLQRDLRDFENTLIQLNQMGEQLLCKPNPATDLVRKQLGQLKDQWQALKQATASQSKAVGGARNLQEFNRKVDRLEAWIKEKEEADRAAKLQGENMDRMQLSKRILDLKQDEQLHRDLHEEINQLALKLEKQGKAEGKNINARRKHINKMWLKVQSHLKDYHQNLQLALEVSSFYQQAENIICAISNRRKSVFVQNERESGGDRELRDIGSQVMMLEVTVSQLSKLHPTLAETVIQKQGEVKEEWALLQKAVRTEKSALPASSPDFSRRDDDPRTPYKEQMCSMGAETQRMMGKEIKEEQNRLKGHLSVGNPGKNRKLTSSQDEEQSHAPTVTGSSIAHADDVIGRTRPGMERKPVSQSKAGIPPGHNRPRPQLHTQLQKFTVSADKTLAWLKDNVAMATQACCWATRDGFEAARRRQAVLEQEIQSNAARIELVKKEGRGLVRARHPGSRKIEEFLGQLEGLWEELKRRHRRNQLLLQEAERLSLEAVRVLLQLDAVDRGLQTVEASLGGHGRAGDPQAVTAAEQESSLLERELSESGLQLRILRQDVERLRLRSCRHLHSQQLPLRLQQVEERCRRVQSALSQQSSELRDTRMLTEFLERVELEESQAQQDRRHGDLAQTLHSETGCRASMLGLRGDRAQEPLLQGMGDPVEELREAVEMLNDTVRERGRSLSQEQGLTVLLSRHSSLTAGITQRLTRAAQLGADVQGAESDMAVRCEPERSGLEALQEQQEELETDLVVLEQEVEEVMELAGQLEDQCPGGAQGLVPQLRTTLQAWAELRRRCADNRARLQQFAQLRCFFRKYLAIISWTEDTRDRIFSESALHDGTGSEKPEASDIDANIERKFKDFDNLAAAGQGLIGEGHHLTNLIQERMEELRSMLGWILVRWRSQKHQKKNGRKEKAEHKGDAIYSEATVSAVPQPELPGLAGTPANQPAEGPSCHDKRTEGGYEVMSSVGLWGGASNTPTPQAPPLILTQEPSTPSVGGAVSVVLSLAKPGDRLQGDATGVQGATEHVHRPVESHSSACKDFWRRCQGLLENTFGSLKRKRKIFRQSMDEVSTYLHVSDSKAAPFAGGSVTLPRPSCHAKIPASSSSSSSSFCSPPWAGPAPCHAPNHAPPGTGSSSSSVLSSLKLRSKRRKRKRDVRRHTIQRIMGMGQPEEGDGACSTHTWPLKDRKRKESTASESTDYLRNPLAQDIDAECSGQSDFTVSLSAPAGPGRHCRHLSLGSVLTFDLQRDAGVIPSVPDIITIGPAELTRRGADHQTEGTAPFSTFKLSRSHADRPRPQTREEVCLQKDPRSLEATAFSIPRISTQSNPDPNRSEQGQSMDTLTSTKHNQSEQRRSIHMMTSAKPNQSEQRQSMGTMTNTNPNQTEQRQSMNTLTTDLSEQRQTTSSKYLSDQRQTLCSNYLSEQRQITSSDGLSDHGQTTSSKYLSDQRQTLCSNYLSEQRQITLSESLSEQGQPTQSEDRPEQRQTSLSDGLLDLQLSRLSGISSLQEEVVQEWDKMAAVLDVQRRDPTSSSPSVAHLWPPPLTTPVPAPHRQTPEPPLPPPPRRVLSLEKPGLSGNGGGEMANAVPPDRQQFEEEEEELEGIWRNRQSICSDVMYQLAWTPPGHAQEPRPQEDALVHRKLLTASAPSLLVPELRPSAKASSPNPNPNPSSNPQQNRSSKPHRKSWASFLSTTLPCGPIALVNETAADSVTLPHVQDQEKYIYQYREEEEEEEEGAEEGVEVDTGCPKVQSRSLLSVHMGGAPNGREEPGQNPTDGGHPRTTGPEFQSMEGTLERKHRLQPGGKKAPCRAWSSSHAVLYKQTLCFYLDRKHTLRSSETGLPLSLVGAECCPALEYTKKNNCFSLRLRDGSEFLLSASSRFLMRKWLLKIQANAGLSESDSSRSFSKPSSQGNLPITRRGHSGTARDKEIIVLTRASTQNPQWHYGNLEDLPPRSSSDAGHSDSHSSLCRTGRQRLTQRPRFGDPSLSDSLGRPSSKRRSQSFTSATYQTITPVPPNPAVHGGGSSYSVTLVIGDEATPTISETPQLIGWGQEAFLDSSGGRGYASLPRPRNKSVFRRFFGKKEWTHDV